MSKETTHIKSIALANTENGTISIENIKEPYGAGSGSVVSIGISLNGKEIDWKSHIPVENIDAVIDALNEAKTKF